MKAQGDQSQLNKRVRQGETQSYRKFYLIESILAVWRIEVWYTEASQYCKRLHRTVIKGSQPQKKTNCIR